MAYFGSTIEGAANTAFDAQNRIAAATNQSAWQAYNAAAQQAQQRAQMEQMRFANAQAMRQAADADYFRRQARADDAARFQTQLGLTREGMAAQEAARADERAFRQKQYDWGVGQSKKAEELENTMTENLPDAVIPFLDAAEQELTYAKEARDSIRKSMEIPMQAAARLGGDAIQWDARTNQFVLKKNGVITGQNAVTFNQLNAQLAQMGQELQKADSAIRQAQMRQYDINKDLLRNKIAVRVNPETGRRMKYNMVTGKWSDITDYFGGGQTPERTPEVPGGGSDMSQNELRINAPATSQPVSILPNYLTPPTEPANYVGTPVVGSSRVDSSAAAPTSARRNAGADYWFQGPLTGDRYIQDFAGATLAAGRAAGRATLGKAVNAGDALNRSIFEATGTPYRGSYIADNSVRHFFGVEPNTNPNLVFPEGAVPTDRRNRFLMRGNYFNQPPDPATATNAPVAVAPPMPTVTTNATPVVPSRMVLPFPTGSPNQMRGRLVIGQAYQHPVSGVVVWNGTKFVQ